MRIENPFRSAFDLVIRKSPLDTQLVIIRRCNLSCGYCTEYDTHSKEIPFDVLRTRIDAIHRLRSANISLLGGEPLLHTRIDDVVRHASRRSQVSMTTNGFLLSREMIDRLGDAGLSNLQLSIDAMRPDPARYIQKTFEQLKPKLDRLAKHARFDVHVTTVLCRESVADFEEMSRALARYPFRLSVNIVHDENGRSLVEGPDFVRAWKRHYDEGRPFSFIEQEYGERLLRGERPSWTCRAGGRFLYVTEDGTAELCSGQRGRIGKKITEYTHADVRAHVSRAKGCEKGCSILCAYRDSMLDNDPAGLARALYRGLRAGAIRLRRPKTTKPAEAPRRHLPVAAE